MPPHHPCSEWCGGIHMKMELSVTQEAHPWQENVTCMSLCGKQCSSPEKDSTDSSTQWSSGQLCFGTIWHSVVQCSDPWQRSERYTVSKTRVVNNKDQQRSEHVWVKLCEHNNKKETVRGVINVYIDGHCVNTYLNIMTPMFINIGYLFKRYVNKLL